MILINACRNYMARNVKTPETRNTTTSVSTNSLMGKPEHWADTNYGRLDKSTTLGRLIDHQLKGKGASRVNSDFRTM